MKGSASGRDLLIRGRILLAIVIVAAGTGGFTLGYFVGRSMSPSAPLPIGQSVNQVESSPSTPNQAPDLKTEAPPAVVPSGQSQPAETGAPENTVSPPQSASSKEKATEDTKPVSPEPAASSEEKVVYTVQAGAFRGRKDAEALKHKLEAKGYEVSIKKETSSKGVTYYKVRAGEFQKKKEASVLALKLKKTDNLNAFATLKK